MKFFVTLVLFMTIAFAYEANAQNTTAEAPDTCKMCKVLMKYCTSYRQRRPSARDVAYTGRHRRQKKKKKGSSDFYDLTVGIIPDNSVSYASNDSETVVITPNDSTGGSDTSLVIDGETNLRVVTFEHGKPVVHVIDWTADDTDSTPPEETTDKMVSKSETTTVELTTKDEPGTETQNDPSPASPTSQPTPVLTHKPKPKAPSKPTQTKEQRAPCDKCFAISCDSALTIAETDSARNTPDHPFHAISFLRKNMDKMPDSDHKKQAQILFDKNPDVWKVTFKIDRVEARGCVEECKWVKDVCKISRVRSKNG